MTVYTIKPKDLADPDSEESKAVAKFLNENKQLDFIEKNKAYTHGDHTFTFTHNIIKNDDPTKANLNEFYLVSNKHDDDKMFILGAGATSKARVPIGKLIVSEKSLSYEEIKPSNSEYAVLIQNRQHGSRYDTSHTDEIAQARYEKLRDNFEEMGAQKPKTVTKEKQIAGQDVSLIKSYSLAKNLPGQDSAEAIEQYVDAMEPSTKAFLDQMIIPLLEQYKKQLSDREFAHRDIKPANIRVKFIWNFPTKENPIATVNFLDFDDAKKFREKDGGIGSPGYIPPEVFNEPPVSQARDIFALGVLIAEFINPFHLAPQNAIPHAIGKDKFDSGVEQNDNQNTLVKEMGCYDAEKLLLKAGVPEDDILPTIFASLDVAATEPLSPKQMQAQKDILVILKSMTALDPAKRPSIEQVITEFKRISQNLVAEKAAVKEKTNTSSTTQIQGQLAHGNIAQEHKVLAEQVNQKETNHQEPIPAAMPSPKTPKADKGAVEKTKEEAPSTPRKP